MSSARVPYGFWATSTGKSQHVPLIILCVALSVVAALAFYGSAPLNESSAKVRKYRASVSETLGFLMGSLVADELQEYESLVRKFILNPSSTTLTTSLKDASPLNIVELAASFFEVSKSRLGGSECLVRVERFAIGADRRASSNRKWNRGEGLVGGVWERGNFEFQLIGGPSDAFDPDSHLRAGAAITVLSGSSGKVIGVVVITGPVASLPALSRGKGVLDPYRLTLANLVAEYS